MNISIYFQIFSPLFLFLILSYWPFILGGYINNYSIGNDDYIAILFFFLSSLSLRCARYAFQKENGMYVLEKKSRLISLLGLPLALFGIFIGYQLMGFGHVLTLVCLVTMLVLLLFGNRYIYRSFVKDQQPMKAHTTAFIISFLGLILQITGLFIQYFNFVLIIPGFVLCIAGSIFSIYYTRDKIKTLLPNNTLIVAGIIILTGLAMYLVGITYWFTAIFDGSLFALFGFVLCLGSLILSVYYIRYSALKWGYDRGELGIKTFLPALIISMFGISASFLVIYLHLWFAILRAT